MTAAVGRFAAAVAGPAAEVDLAEAALAVAAGGDPLVDPAVWLEELDRLAAGVAGLDGLRRRLFAEAGFTGVPPAHYYEPESSFLHRVLQRRRGIPISLAVVAMQVGRRAGVELEGIGMPGHFLLRDVASGAYLDAYGGGVLLDEDGCGERFRASTGADPDTAFGPHLLPVVDAHGILTRMLANLAAIYRARGAATELEWVLRMRLVLPGGAAAVGVEFGEALAAQGRFRDGAQELDRLAQQAASPADADALERAARSLRARLS